MMAGAKTPAGVPFEHVNDDGTVTRTYGLRLPAAVWAELDAVAANQNRETITLITSILPSWVKSYIATWNQAMQASKEERRR